MAVERVFNTTELLEAVLLHVPFKDMLKAKTVTRRWKEIIEPSLSLQRVTYISPAGEVLRPLHQSGTIYLSILDDMPLLADKVFKAIPIFEEKQAEIIPAQRQLEPWQHWTIPWPRNINYKLHLFAMEFDADGRIRMPTVFRSMYFAQPPISAAYLFDRSRHSNWNPPILYSSSGITFRCVEQVLQSVLKQPRKPYYAPPRSDGLIRAECAVLSQR